MSNAKNSWCWTCWRDWKDDFLNLSPWEQEQFLEKNPRVNPNNFYRGKCPYCGTRYGDDDFFSFDFFADDDDDDFFEDEQELADWEEEPGKPRRQ